MFYNQGELLHVHRFLDLVLGVWLRSKHVQTLAFKQFSAESDSLHYAEGMSALGVHLCWKLRNYLRKMELERLLTAAVGLL